MAFEKTISKENLIRLIDELKTTLASKSEGTIHVEDKAIRISKDWSCEVEFEEDEDEAELEIELKWRKTSTSPDLAPGKYEIFQGKDKQWYFHLKAANNQIILASEGYTAKDSAKKGIESVKHNATIEQFEQRVSRAKQTYFVLKAKNGEIIGTSQMYKRKAGCEKGIRSVIHHASATVEELT